MVSEGVFYLPCVIYGGMCLVNKGEKPGMLQGESHEQAGCQPLHGQHGPSVAQNVVKIPVVADMLRLEYVCNGQLRKFQLLNRYI